MISGIIRACGLILFLYLSWRNLRDNFKSDELISYGWFLVLAFLLGSRVAYGLLNWGAFDSLGDWFLVWQVPGVNYLGGYLSLVGASAFFANKKNWKFWPLMEDMSVNILWLLMFTWMDELVRSDFDLSALLNLGIMFLGWLALLWVKRKYRSFVWYKSGKKGFVFLFVNILIFLLLAGVNGFVWGETVRMYLFLGVVIACILELLALGEVLAGLNIYAKKRR